MQVVVICKYSRIGLAHLKSHIAQEEIDSTLILVAFKKQDKESMIAGVKDQL